MTKIKNQFLGWAFTFWLITSGISKLVQSVGWETIIVMAAAAVFLCFLFKYLLKKKDCKWRRVPFIDVRRYINE